LGCEHPRTITRDITWVIVAPNTCNRGHRPRKNSTNDG
jgi:hypothetical protein